MAIGTCIPVRKGKGRRKKEESEKGERGRERK